jgi:hypothetical protein
MTPPTVLTRLLLAGLSIVALPAAARGQAWSVDLSAGRTVYDPISIDVGTSNAMGTLRYDALRGLWVHGTAAVPMRSGDPLWTAFGTGMRVAPRGAERSRVHLGADLDGQAFLFRDAVADLAGRGGVAGVAPFASVRAGAGRVELRGGWRGQTLAFGGFTDRRSVFESGVRALYGERLRVQSDLRWLHAPEGTFPFVGASLAHASAPFQWWAQAGKWLSDALDDAAWGAGAGVTLTPGTTVWASVRQEAPDPLYWNESRRSWTVGVTRRLGGGPPLARAAPAREAGMVVVRVPAAHAPGSALFIAGDFNEWKPVAMEREGTDWVARLPLAPGVYHYAFRSAAGEWFVPTVVAGRRDDGMGGHVAVLLVG